MAWTSPRTWVANVTAITALALNTDLRDNLNYLKGLLDGTGSGNVTVPAALFAHNDSNWGLNRFDANRPFLVWDGNDWIEYNRAANEWQFYVGASKKLTIDGGGKLTGAGFYDSGIFSLASGGSVQKAHGLGARPRFYSGVYDLNNNDANLDTPATPSAGVGTAVEIYQSEATYLAVRNGTASTLYIRLFAML